MRRHLDTHLDSYGRSVADLVAEIDDSLGAPLLAVAAGSVLHGFGNPTSDVDVHVVVDNPQVTDLPITSHTLGVTVDVSYLHAGAVRKAAHTVTADHRPTDRSGWRSARRWLKQLDRLTFGLPLMSEAEWMTWHVAMREHMPGYATRWWRAETLRYRTAARLLAPVQPLVAAQRYCTAGLSALDVHATRAGQVYVGPKWIGVKLHNLGRDDLLPAYEQLLDVPVATGEAPAYLAAAERLLDRLTEDWGLPDDPIVELSSADGVEVWRSHTDVALLQRWRLSGVEGPAGRLDAVADPGWRWSGPQTLLTDELRALIEADLVWLSVREVQP